MQHAKLATAVEKLAHPGVVRQACKRGAADMQGAHAGCDSSMKKNWHRAHDRQGQRDGGWRKGMGVAAARRGQGGGLLKPAY